MSIASAGDTINHDFLTRCRSPALATQRRELYGAQRAPLLDALRFIKCDSRRADDCHGECAIARWRARRGTHGASYSIG